MAKKTAPPEAPKTSVGDPRGTYLDALLRQIQARAISIRHYLGESKQNPMLGLAAEKGVRDVLRQVLPRRFGVTSGFMCDADGSLLAAAVEKESVSPQTDLLLYDASSACPLYRMDEIEVIDAADVQGLIEVKDVDDGEYALRSRDAALAHVAKLSEFAPHAFRAIVLLRSKVNEQKNAAHVAYDLCVKQTQDSDPLQLVSRTTPHVLYGVEAGYIAVYEYTTNQLHFFEPAPAVPTAALADFLRVTTSYFAGGGLTSPSFAAGLTHRDPTTRPALKTLSLPDRAPLPPCETWWSPRTPCARPTSSLHSVTGSGASSRTRSRPCTAFPRPGATSAANFTAVSPSSLD